MSNITDVAIVGAGPVGLCLARMLALAGLKVVVIERLAEKELAEPAFDGREIALTQHSVQTMRELGLWQEIAAIAISPLRDARVFNGSSLFSIDIGHAETQYDELGYLVANHLIRKAAYKATKSSPSITLKTEARVVSIKTGADHALVTLANNEIIDASLLVGADSRFSETRRAMGISADMHDFGKTMMVCVMEHEISHQHAAWEWFDYGQTLALLPMNGMRSSVVITLPPKEIEVLMAMPESEFNRAMTARFQSRLGNMRLVSSRHAYPLITAYASRMVANRFALIGDAAVGMHPVTAHGFNFGLKSVTSLSREILAAHAAAKDIGDKSHLLRYEREHRRHTRPLFMATHAIAKLYSSDSPPARLLRASALRLGRLSPFKRVMAGFLADAKGLPVR